MPTLIPQPNGGALLSGGVPGHDGSNAGRKPDEHREWLKSTVRNPSARKVFEAHVQSGDIRFWDHAAKYSEEPTHIQLAAQMETPDGTTFTLLIGDRGDDA